jgi:hypothetical protein
MPRPIAEVKVSPAHLILNAAVGRTADFSSLRVCSHTF